MPILIGMEPPRDLTNDLVLPSDAELITRFMQGDERALALVFAAYALRLERYATTIVGTPDIARDIVQEAFISLWERRATLSIRSTLQAYLFTVVRSRALMALRADRRVAEHQATLDTAVGMGMADPGPAARVEREEILAHVTAVLAVLSPRIRDVARLRWIEGLSYAEIAETCGTSTKTVENQLRIATRTLRDRLMAFDRDR